MSQEQKKSIVMNQEMYDLHEKFMEIVEEVDSKILKAVKKPFFVIGSMSPAENDCVIFRWTENGINGINGIDSKTRKNMSDGMPCNLNSIDDYPADTDICIYFPFIAAYLAWFAETNGYKIFIEQMSETPSKIFMM